MASPETITIGIAARNEEKTIGQTLRSVVDALNQFPLSAKAHITVALNGCTDNTENVVRSFIKDGQRSGRELAITLVHSEEGLIQAQRKIIETNKSSGIVLFLDADLLIDAVCIKELIQAMLEKPKMHIAWAKVIPYDTEHPSFKNLILNFADYHPEIMTNRVYFSGRAFAIRGYDIPFTSTKPEQVDSRLYNFLRLSIGPLIDDVFLSRSTIHKYGTDSIVYIPEAKVFFQPIASIKDFYYSQRRTIFERKRLNLLFPEHSYVVKKYYKRSLIREKYSTLPIKAKVAYRLYVILYASIRKIALNQYAIYGMLLKLGLPLSNCKVWPALKTTKKAFQNEPTN